MSKYEESLKQLLNANIIYAETYEKLRSQREKKRARFIRVPDLVKDIHPDEGFRDKIEEILKQYLDTEEMRERK